MEMIREYLNWTRASCDQIDPSEVQKLIDVLMDARKKAQRIFIIGNGGSAATASHFCEDLGKCTLRNLEDPLRFKVISLTDNLPYVSAWANDNGYDLIFEQQLRNLSESGDVVIGISASGNSPNILNAIEYANASGMITVGISGFSGGKLKKMSDHSVHVSIDDYGMAENMHMIIVHMIIIRTTALVADET